MPVDPRDPADQPTQHLAPTPVPAARPRVPADGLAPRGPVDGGQAFADLAASVRAMRNALVGIGLATLLALVVGIYALSEARKDDGPGASSARVSQLDDRVDRLSRQLQKLRSGPSSADNADVDALRQQLSGTAKASDVESLRSAVDKLRAQPASGDSDGTQTAIDDISGRVDELAAAVKQLQQEPQTAP